MKVIKCLNRSIAIISILALNFLYAPVYAASLTSVSDTLTRLRENTSSSHTIVFTLSGTNTFAAGETITIDFGEDSSGFTVDGASSVIVDFDFNDGTERTIVAVNTGAPACSAGVNNVAVGINDTTGVVTLEACSTYTSSGSGATVTIEYGAAASGTNRVTNPAANATYVVNINGTLGDTGSFAVAILDSANDDQVIMTATVDPSITFSLSANSSAFGTLAPTIVDTASTNITLTIGTNAFNGYSILVRDTGSGANPGLYNSAIAAIIGSGDATYSDTADLSSVSSGYGIQASCTAGCTTGTHIASRWRQGADIVGGLEITDTNLVAFNTAMSADHTVQIVHKAKAAAFTPAGSYSDTITYIATGNF